MHHIAENNLPTQLARHGIVLLSDPLYQPSSAARPANAHWAAAHCRVPAPESTHDFLVLGTLPEWLRPAQDEIRDFPGER